jgi:hypothetical protein
MLRNREVIIPYRNEMKLGHGFQHRQLHWML